MYGRKKIGSAEDKKEWATAHLWSSVATKIATGNSGSLSRQRILVLCRDRVPKLRTLHGLGARNGCAREAGHTPTCYRVGYVLGHGPRVDRMAWITIEFFFVAIALSWPYVATVFDVSTQFDQGGKSLNRDRELWPPVVTMIVAHRQGLATTRPGKRSPA